MTTTPAAARKIMTIGEGGTALAFVALALGSIFVAANAHTPEYAFHAWLFAAGSVAAVFTIINHYYGRSAEGSPLTVDGKPNYNMGPVKVATAAAMVWGIAGFTVGLWAALELAYPVLNFDLPWISFGRLRPLHTSAVIFAFGGNVLLATSFYVVQRTCRARLAGEVAPWFVVLGYNFFIVIAGTGYLLGITQSKEYAEPEWYADLWLTAVWVTYLLVYLGTIMRRSEPHIYVANWFYLAFIVTVAMLHLGNNAAIPVSLFSPKSYIVWAGVQDAMVQWWYGHNAVGFFLTAGFLGIVYYFIPKRAERPIYSYRLSIIHFWSLIFLYIWAGPHHLHYTALPDWAQTLGHDLLDHAVDAVLGRHDQRRDDAVGRLGQAAHRPGPAHDGRVAGVLRHVHLRRSADVGENGQLAQPLHRLDRSGTCIRARSAGSATSPSERSTAWCPGCGTGHSSTRSSSSTGTSGSRPSASCSTSSAMWVSGIMQGLMWRAYTKLGFLEYSFIETVEAMHPFYVIRALGGALFLAGALIMAWNLWRTVHPSRSAVPLGSALAPAE